MRELLSLYLLSTISLSADTLALYLTWYKDPCTTMAIQWHTPMEELQDTVFLETSSGDWAPIKGSHIEFGTRLIHKVFLEGLTPNKEYGFRIGDDPAIYKFETAPDRLDQPLRFCIGGDVYKDKELFRTMSRALIHQNPLFAVLGGDIAYAISGSPFQLRSSSIKQWFAFLRDWKEEMLTPEGRVIPFLLVPGNHDITPNDSDLFFTLFSFPERKLYRTIDFDNYLSLVLLDTDHLDPIEGKQTTWLAETLASKRQMPYCFAIYHVAAYPSHHPFSDPRAEKIRQNWSPLFEEYQLPVVFEHHNHTFKKTFPIKKNKIDESGVIYLGDGCWGTKPRTIHDLWYIDKKVRKNHVYLIELTQSSAKVEAIDSLGKTIDHLEFTVSKTR